MGRTYTAECVECNRLYNYDVGIGAAYNKEDLLNYNNSFNLLTLFKEKNRKEELINILKSNNYNLLDGYGHKMMICDTCKTIYSRFTFSLVDESSNCFETIFRCHTCRKKLRELNECEIIDNIYNCPHCNSNIKFNYSCDWN